MQWVKVDFNDARPDGRLVASRRRMPDVTLGEVVCLADDGDAAEYEATVLRIGEREVEFDVRWATEGHVAIRHSNWGWAGRSVETADDGTRGVATEWSDRLQSV